MSVTLKQLMADYDLNPSMQQVWRVYLFCASNDIMWPDVINQRIVEFTVKTAINSVQNEDIEASMRKRDEELITRQLVEWGEQAAPRKKVAMAEKFADYMNDHPDIFPTVKDEPVDSETIRRRMYPRKKDPPDL